MISTKDIAWLAGILDGEGYFGIVYSKQGRQRPSPRIGVSSTDRDIIERVATLLKSNVLGPRTRKGSLGNKPCWYTQKSGDEAIEWLLTLYVLMCARRRERFRSIINIWKLNSESWYAPSQDIPKEIWDLIS